MSKCAAVQAATSGSYKKGLLSKTVDFFLDKVEQQKFGFLMPDKDLPCKKGRVI